MAALASIAADHDASKSMPAFAKAYGDAEVARLANYVIDHFGGRQGRVTPRMVRKARQ